MDSALEDALDDLDGVTLVLTPAEDYQGTTTDIVRHLTGDGRPGVYVTVNKPVETVKELFADEDIPDDDVFFIDAITAANEQGTPDIGNAIFLRSPQHLTDISIAMEEAVTDLADTGRFLVFDSMSTLTIYNDSGTVSQFGHHLTGKIRAWNITGILLTLPSDADEEFISRLMQFCDHVVDIGA